MTWAVRALILAATAVLLMTACGRAIDRPLRGAAPGTEAPAPTVGAPPTLSPSEALRFRALPSPSPGVSASPSASPSAVPAPPIVRTIAPPANGNVPPGAPVPVSAILVGRGADLATASLTLDGADTGAQIDKRSAREWTIHTARPLGPGPHTARVLVRDTANAAGGFTWQFTVADPEAAPAPAPESAVTPAPAPRPAPPTATPRRT